MTDDRRPIPRRVVAGYVVLIVLALVVLIALADALRRDHDPVGPLTPEIPSDIDILREEVTCPLPAGREGEEREEAPLEPVPPEEVTSNQLYDCPQTYDGRLITYTGEVVGALLPRREAVWAQLNDDVYGDAGAPLPTHRDFRGGNAGVGALLPFDVAAMVETIGGPGRHGDVLRVVARFERVDEATGEVAILRVQSARLEQAGRPVVIPDSPARPIVASLAAAMALGVVLAERRSRARR